MSWTELEYRIVKFYGNHQYDAFAETGKVGLGRCACGEEMYYSEHTTHFARAFIAEFGLDQATRQCTRDGCRQPATHMIAVERTGKSSSRSWWCEQHYRPAIGAVSLIEADQRQHHA